MNTKMNKKEKHDQIGDDISFCAGLGGGIFSASLAYWIILFSDTISNTSESFLIITIMGMLIFIIAIILLYKKDKSEIKEWIGKYQK